MKSRPSIASADKNLICLKTRALLGDKNALESLCKRDTMMDFSVDTTADMIVLDKFIKDKNIGIIPVGDINFDIKYDRQHLIDMIERYQRVGKIDPQLAINLQAARDVFSILGSSKTGADDYVQNITAGVSAQLDLLLEHIITNTPSQGKS